MYFRLFALSFASLFLELMVIRWVPSVVRLVAYYANLMLISSFLGLGLGAMIAPRGWKLFSLFPILLAVDIVVLLTCGHRMLPTSSSEMKFYGEYVHWVSYLVLIGIFVLNTMVFIPLGEEIGNVFGAMDPLKAYAWDLLGSLCGTIGFGTFSLLYFSPVTGVSIVAVLFLLLSPLKRWIWAIPLLLAVVLCMNFGSNRMAIWSPYYYITVHNAFTGLLESAPPDNVRTMMDPPIYTVSVNQDLYHLDGTLNKHRYRDPAMVSDDSSKPSVASGRNPLLEQIRTMAPQYALPYSICPLQPARVAVLGAGGGMDVEASLLSGARSVDAVEIDPVIVAISRRFNASGVYDDPRVHIHNTDARAFLQNARPGYDLIAFGFLDSQALFSYGSNVRLDGFIYTVESFHQAFSLLKDGGVMSVSFSCPRDFLALKLLEMVREATDSTPLAYSEGRSIIICAVKGTGREAPVHFGQFKRIAVGSYDVPKAYDDWPFLYISQRTIPTDYLVVVGTLLLLSLTAVLSLRRLQISRADGNFFFLGMAFLLLQTLSIGDCSLYFGTTWVVTTIVITGVLLMVLAANLIVFRLRAARWMYLPLLGSVMLLAIFPRNLVLAFPPAGRLLWALLVMPLPIFFAGLIFSSAFRAGRDRATLFGANLIGATIGGFCEYLGMATGMRLLWGLVLLAYIASFVCQYIRFSSPKHSALVSSRET
jgi:hypothetical protein